MPGIKVKKGLARTLGNRPLYINLLDKFHRDYADATSRVQDALDNNDTEQAQRLIHTIKGVSGSIGANDLERSASELEDAIIRKEAIRIERLIKSFNKTLMILLNSINSIIEIDSEKEEKIPVVPKADSDVLLKLLLKLNPYILGREAKPCKELMKEIVGYSWPDRYNQPVSDLNRYVMKYQFKNAQTLISQIIAQLEK
jgi:HPt (histidine-containing phosphotransfer) domain-containing protein